MNLSCGIVGLPNVGKSTLFNALLKKQVALSANYPFATIEPNVGVCEVPDERLEKLKEIVEKTEGLGPSFKIIPATVSFVDIAGLVKGAAQGEGLGNQFLSHIREVDVIVFVLRDFADENIIRAGSVDPQSDKEILETELTLADLDVAAKLLANSQEEKGSDWPIITSILQSMVDNLKQGKTAGEVEVPERLKSWRRGLPLLTIKPVIDVYNVSEDDYKEKRNQVLGSSELVICAKLEEELASLEPEEQKQYLAELGVSEPGLNILIKKAYETLGLITFFTAGPKEVRAWTTNKGALAPQAAGVIHTDFERGFIAAEVIPWDQLVDAGGWQAAKGKGLVKTIGKTEEIKDGYVVEFRFSV